MPTAGGSHSSRDLIAALHGACESRSMHAGSLGLITNGRVTTLSAAGNLYEGGPPTEVSTLFGVGSIVKLLTAVAVARSEVMELSALVSDYLPGLGLDGVTIEHLLAHTSGLPFAGRDEGPTDHGALARFVQEDVAKHERRTSPGEIASYTPSGYSVVGRILEILERRSFDDVLNSLVLEPSGMTRASVPATVDGDAVAWPHHGEGGAPRREERLWDNSSVHPAGFLFASLQDLVGLATGILEGFLVDGATWEGMTRQHASRHISHVPYPLVLIGTGFGLGCQVGVWNGQPVVRHPGRQSSYHCSIDFLPESASAVILLTNGADDRTFNDLLNSCYEAVAGRGRLIEEPGLEPITPGLRDTWVGTYVQPSRGRVVEVSDVEGDLVFRDPDVEAPLYNLGAGRAIVPLSYGSAPVWFPTTKGPVPYLTLWGEPYFSESPSRWHPDDSGPYTGTYRDSFFPLEATDLEVRFEDGGWSVAQGGEWSPTVQLGERKLASRHGLLAFDEDGSSVQVGDATIYARS